MRRRDRQNEIIVALAVAIAMGFAVVFSIVLSLDDDSRENETQTPAAAETRPTVATPFAPSATVSEEITDEPTETPTDEATDEVTEEVAEKPTEKPTDTDEPPSETPTDTDEPPTPTDTPSPTTTDTDTPTPTPTDTDTPSPTPTDTDTPSPTSSPTPSDTPTRTPRPTRTDTRTPSPTPTPVSTQTTVPLVQQTRVSNGPTSTPCMPRNDWEIYTVEIGDTFFSIARRYNLSVDQLAAANCIENPSRILAGQPLRVPEGGFNRDDAAIENCNTPNAILTAPRAGESLEGFVRLEGVAHGPDFRRYILDWRPDDPRVDFRSFAEVFNAVVERGNLGRFNTDAFDPGLYWFRLRVLETNDFIIGECSIRVRFR